MGLTRAVFYVVAIVIVLAAVSLCSTGFLTDDPAGLRTVLDALDRLSPIRARPDRFRSQTR